MKNQKKGTKKQVELIKNASKLCLGVVLVVIGVSLDCYRPLFGVRGVLFGSFGWPIIAQGAPFHLVGQGSVALADAK